MRSDTNSFAVSFDLDSYLRRRKIVIGQNDPFIVHMFDGTPRVSKEMAELCLL